MLILRPLASHLRYKATAASEGLATPVHCTTALVASVWWDGGRGFGLVPGGTD